MKGLRSGAVSGIGAAPVLVVLLSATAGVCAAPAIEDRSAMPPPDAVFVERRTQQPAGAQPAAATTAAEATDQGSLGQLYYELQVLQQEVLELRGIIEEQNYRLERMSREQRQRYLDIDRRLTGVVPGGAPVAPGEPASGSGAGRVAGQLDAAAGASEQTAYDRAFGMTRQRDFPDAIAAFEQLLADYPAGTYAPNAYYWLGELYLALDQPELEKSRQAFAQVINVFPDHPKAPDALYKLGVVYDRLGDAARAREYLARVQREHATSAAARLAATYAEQL